MKQHATLLECLHPPFTAACLALLLLLFLTGVADFGVVMFRWSALNSTVTQFAETAACSDSEARSAALREAIAAALGTSPEEAQINLSQSGTPPTTLQVRASMTCLLCSLFPHGRVELSVTRPIAPPPPSCG